MTVDLHCHSTASDGGLSPAALVARAYSNGVTQLALTDHDQLAGLVEARMAANALGMRFINGVEISVTWQNLTVHIVGLNIALDHVPLVDGLKKMADGRRERALEMAAQLAEVGIEGAYEGALAHANGREDLISRTHFARFLVAQRKSHHVRAVFNDYLVAGKPGFVEHRWTSLQEAVAWIDGAGGVAVLAHPGRYPYTEEGQESSLFDDFISVGGRAVEVVTGSHSKKQYALYAETARRYGLLASAGSDFHALNESRVDIGQVPALPAGLTPVWSVWA
ncbi:3',5'-nucleoside bisphosphate phosphatase [Ephemeroptericola cinctiostellae]|uniref:3',5'-nucleoside bisphosphate phosphatase n=1 Tax=Ephemeroptericola cinctiostellae TaxID=2268024 RepID=A0A345DBQ9_9BURK|nr:PHP domain-containing protein [Ephemeroptericola cinctiostellae]AXF85797.1 3',5'-nucleoside bisphosphate phosphatase [Ephemeroptericola cinctiostellae]